MTNVTDTKCEERRKSVKRTVWITCSLLSGFVIYGLGRADFAATKASIIEGTVKAHCEKQEATEEWLKLSVGEIKAEQREQRKTLTDFVKDWKDTNGNGG